MYFQELTTLEVGDYEAEVIFADGRLAMDIFLAHGNPVNKPKAIKCFRKVRLSCVCKFDTHGIMHCYLEGVSVT